MSSSEFTEIANFATESEAAQFRSILEENGVPAFVDGATANTMLSYVGTALGGVRLFVKTTDLDQATEVMRSLNSEDQASEETWFCGACDVEVDGGFEVCWSCGQSRTDVGQTVPELARSMPVDQEPTEETEYEGDASLRRAWRASIIGLVFFPLLTHLYSMILLIRVSLRGSRLSEHGQRLFYRTLIVNIVAVLAWGPIVRAMFR